MNTSTLDGLLEAYTHLSTLNKRALDRFTVVAEHFRRRRIDCILLKGADLLSRLYGIRGVRPMIDIDLLVREADLPAIDEVLRALGYEQAIDGNPAYCAPDRQWTLDILTSIWYLDSKEALDGVWMRAVPRTLGDQHVKGMGSEDLLIFLTAYAVVHRATLSAQFARDVALLVQKEPLDWGFILEEVNRRHLRVPVHYGLSYATSREPIRGIPETVLDQLKPSGIRERAMASLLRRLVTEQHLYGIGLLLLFITRPGAKKWLWLYRSLCPLDTFLSYRYGRAGATRPLRTRLLRVAQLIPHAGLLLMRILPRLVKRREPVLR